MRCPFCNSSKIKVVDKRESGEDAIRRRRECESCKKRWTTYEKIELLPIVVVKRDGRLESFDRNKIRSGIMRAVEKRPVSPDKVNDILNDVENEIRSRGKSEIKSREIGELVMNKLKNVDEVAYIRFASVYRQFKAVEDFEKELKELKKK